MTRPHPHEGRPHLLHSLLEWRALLEMAALPAAAPWLMAAPRGDGHVVLLAPGFMGGDDSLFALRFFLANLGYDVRTWGFGRNVGLQARHIEALHKKVRHLHHVSGRRISVVGWSLGGVFAMYAAHEAPDCVRSVITLGSPVNADPANAKSSRTAQRLYRWVAHPHGPTAHVMQPRMKRLRERGRLDVPVSCLYSLGDGVVPPQEATIAGDPALHENIRVPGSHLGLGFNAIVLAIVADRLAQPEGAWQPFTPQRWWANRWRGRRDEAAPAPKPKRGNGRGSGPHGTTR